MSLIFILYKEYNYSYKIGVILLINFTNRNNSVNTSLPLFWTALITQVKEKGFLMDIEN